MAMRRRRRSSQVDQDQASRFAYLRGTQSGALCYWAPCPRRVIVALFGYQDVEVASYCRRHGRLALREYARAVERHLTERGDVVEAV